MSSATQSPQQAASLKYLQLPDAPAGLNGPVKAWEQPVEMLTYLPFDPDRNPMFLEKRVYQGSSGRVYPLPFIDRIATEPQPKMWQAIHLENEFLRLMILPEIGGRIHIGYDKTTGYDFFYRQNVIKPALVGLAGPWISGGVEFNWPQHHRPATFMPVQTEIKHEDDESVTVWCSDHDPMLRMKGMHGVCLHPGRALINVKVRLFNRTQFTQTFLWWANAATSVHERYQSFFPTDVDFVADHAKRAVTSFPQSRGCYYGVEYGERGRTGLPADEIPAAFVADGSYPPNDLSWYANIPVPTSYMITATEGDFFGGYDHRRACGVVHVANHHIAPGKKQWTWGNHEFGYAWDRCLTDSDGPYIELMAGVYTDNQPDFSYLAPWETKTFEQNWYPIAGIGVPQAANSDCALHVDIAEEQAGLGLYVTRDVGEVTVVVQAGEAVLDQRPAFVDVAHPLLFTVPVPQPHAGAPLRLRVMAEERLLIEYDTAKVEPAKPPKVAVEPPQPAEIGTIEELYLTGLHLNQYHHATRLPESYWLEALNRDPGDSRVNNALGLRHLQRGEFRLAAERFTVAIERLTRLNPNPYDGEPYYNLGITERYLGRDKQAYDALYKAIWNASWRSAAYFALAEIDAKRNDWAVALDHLRRSLRAEADNLNALNLLVVSLEKLGHVEDAAKAHDSIRALDPLDVHSRFRDGIFPANAQDSLDLAFDLIRTGQLEKSLDVLRHAEQAGGSGALPIVLFTLAQIESQLGLPHEEDTWRRAECAALDYCFPVRLEELILLEKVTERRPSDASAFYLLGNWLFDRRRHAEAITAWERSASLRPGFPTVWRNLGIAAFNIRHDAAAAKRYFDRSIAANPHDARVLYERDQLWKRIGTDPIERLAELERSASLLTERDDLSVEIATIYNQLGQPAKSLEILLGRQFQPWEGGEGLVLNQYVRARMLLGKTAIQHDNPADALNQFHAAIDPPRNLSEAKHLLANQSDIYYWIGYTYNLLNQTGAAISWWQRAARQRGDFQQMSVRLISDMSYWTGLALLALGHEESAHMIFHQIRSYALELRVEEPKIDYFATSLPTMLLFEEDLKQRNHISSLFLEAQSLSGLGMSSDAVILLDEVLRLDRNHAGASDLVCQLTQPSTNAR